MYDVLIKQRYTGVKIACTYYTEPPVYLGTVIVAITIIFIDEIDNIKITHPTIICYLLKKNRLMKITEKQNTKCYKSSNQNQYQIESCHKQCEKFKSKIITDRHLKQTVRKSQTKMIPDRILSQTVRKVQIKNNNRDLLYLIIIVLRATVRISLLK